MFGYLGRRLLQTVPALFVVITVTFFMMRLAPGGPFDGERNLPKEIEDNLRAHYGMDLPLWKQYTDYLGKVLQGDLGPSFKYRDFTVTELVLGGFPASFKVGIIAIALAMLVGLLAGAWAALHQNSKWDYWVMAISMVGITIPNFVVAPVLTLVIGIYLNLLPVGGWGSGDIKHIILPVITLALPQIAYIARISRASMIEVLHTNFIRTAYAKGMSTSNIILRHALKPTLQPIVSYLGPATAGILTGSIVVEQIFGIPGIGRYFIQGALNRDYTLVMGVVIFYSALIIMLNFVVDLLYVFLDPKIKFS